MEFNIKTRKEANDYRARIKRFIVDTDNLRDNLFLFVTDDGKGVLYGNAKCAEQINSLLKEFDLNEVLAAKRIVVNVRFCPQSVRGFCPEVAGFNAGTYEVPAYVL
ncbi:MAG: hypothetical protein PUH40_04145 [Lachnospiraceae bacterium]|nr:hypothetical protein [Lachnospiraceae bacterium]